MWLEEKGYKKEEALIGNGIELNGELWCLCSNFNDMYCIDIKKARVKKRVVFDEIPDEKQHMFSGILAVSGYLYLIPYLGRDMVKYHVSGGKIEYIDFENVYKEAGIRRLFIAGCSLKQYLFLFPYDYQNIVRFDTESKQIVLLPMPKGSEKRLPFIRRCAVKENSIWITEDGGNRILQVDAEKMKSSWFSLPEDIHICDFCMWDEKIFCLDTAGKVLIFDTKTGSQVLFADLKSEKFGFVEKSANYLWLIPNKTNRIIRYSEKKGIEKINYPDNFEFSKIFRDGKMRTFSSISSNKLEVTIMPRCNNVLIKIDKKEDRIQFIDLTYSKSLRQGIKDNFFKKIGESPYVPESEGSIEWFLDFMKEKERKAVYENDERIGKAIYFKVMNG